MYAAAKAALESVTQGLAKELGVFCLMVAVLAKLTAIQATNTKRPSTLSILVRLERRCEFDRLLIKNSQVLTLM